MIHMSSSKTSGNLRDFRIDSRPTHVPLPQRSAERPVERAPECPAPQPAGRSAVRTPQHAQQSIKTRATSVTEWEQESSSFDAESLWKSWEEDLDTSSTASASRALTVNPVSEPARPPQVRETLRRELESTLTSGSSPKASSASTKPQEALEEESAQTRSVMMPWAAELAHTERRMERLGEVEYSNSFKKQEMLKAQTAEFMAVLRHEFGRQIEVFNEARQSGAQAVHLYRITNTEQDFMLFRNGVKLVVSGQRSGRVLFAFNQFLGQIYASSQNPNFELEAQWGAFDQLQWTYRNERVQVQDIIRFFLSEFVRQSYK